MGFQVVSLLGLILISIFSIDHAFACEGHKLKVNYFKNCGNVATNVIKIQENSTMTLTSDCEIVPNSCGETTGFKTANVKFQIWKNNVPVLRNEIDGCEMASKLTSEYKMMLQIFGLPEKCPVEKMIKCADGSKKVDVGKFRKFLSLARGGPVKAEIKVDHDTGKSCFLFEFEVIKKPSSSN